MIPTKHVSNRCVYDFASLCIASYSPIGVAPFNSNRALQTRCGKIGAHSGPFYCSTDYTISLPLNWVDVSGLVSTCEFGGRASEEGVHMPKSTGTGPAYPAARENAYHRLRFGEVLPYNSSPPG